MEGWKKFSKLVCDRLAELGEKGLDASQSLPKSAVFIGVFGDFERQPARDGGCCDVRTCPDRRTAKAKRGGSQ